MLEQVGQGAYGIVCAAQVCELGELGDGSWIGQVGW